MLNFFPKLYFWDDDEEDDAKDDAPKQKGIRLSVYTEGAECNIFGLNFQIFSKIENHSKSSYGYFQLIRISL